MNDIKKLVSETFNITQEEVTNKSGPDTIQAWDSLGQLSLILAIEQKYGITLEMNEIFEILNVGDIYNLLEKRGII